MAAFDGLVPVADVSVGAWLEPRMCGFGGRVCSVVPTTGFEAFARILHPAGDGDRAIRWAEVSEQLGRTMHPLVQWNSIAGVREVEVTEGRWPRRHRSTTTTSEWAGEEPETGNLPPAELGDLVDVLTGFTAQDDCFHAVWEGWGWLDGRGVAYLTAETGRWGRRASPGAVPPALAPEVLAGPRLRLPGRDHVLFRGPLRAALSIGHEHPGGGVFWPQSPSLLWPADRSWCVATEIDFDSTLVAGSRALIDAVLAAADLEAWPVGPEDDLTEQGDLINR
jgi:hypothetical protein